MLGPVFFFLLLVVQVAPDQPAASRMAAVALLMATWWITDAVPLFATALLPLALFPLLGLSGGGETATQYFNSTIVLYLGGFLIALAMQRWNLHRRIALGIIQRVGGTPNRLVLGFMLAAGFLSMWISNTATAIMMVPIGLAIVVTMEETFGTEDTHPFTVAVMLGIAYACSMGGISTLVGTPPNLSFSRIFAVTYPDAPPIGFGQWFLLGLPIGATMLFVTWIVLTRVFFRTPDHVHADPSVVADERARLGSPSFEEKVVMAIFATTALLWVFRVRISLGFLEIPGWSEFFPDPSLFDDGTVAIALSALLFLIPARDRGEGKGMILDATVIRRLPWDIVLLFGGGFALAYGFRVTGLSDVIGGRFAGLSEAPPLLIVLLICLVITFLTELTSNLATTEMILPILASVSVAAGLHPLLLMVPATLSASCAFMMPVATPPNAIVFGSERVRIAEMARAGIVLNLIGVVIVASLFYAIGPVVFDMDPTTVPEWATPSGVVP
ncbi:MAG: DASS family sodium-coupled anion symporter [Gemmatimonadota bacterium]